MTAPRHAIVARGLTKGFKTGRARIDVLKDVDFDALHGDTYCSVSVGDPGDLPGIGALEAANEGSTDIPDSVLDPASAALGTLCNRIFGSGNTTPDLAALAAAVASAQAALSSAAPTS